ncbi:MULTISPECIES: hypothetical protein [Stenotrophomonas]|uniref:hypothetical protein n=1 Tax=Stenotrophomonas TaxID=40323 RepID=UPI00087326F9|nr:MULTISPECIES: hypothetical protein [Stenotrophomonas]OEZ00020.1 hypothetical protein BIY45_13735 [Stenotrophomonas sp. BIIR7]
MFKIDLKKVVTVGAVRDANMRLMSGTPATGSFIGSAPGSVISLQLTSEQINQAGRVAFNSLKRR